MKGIFCLKEVAQLQQIPKFQSSWKGGKRKERGREWCPEHLGREWAVLQGNLEFQGWEFCPWTQSSPKSPSLEWPRWKSGNVDTKTGFLWNFNPNPNFSRLCLITSGNMDTDSGFIWDLSPNPNFSRPCFFRNPNRKKKKDFSIGFRLCSQIHGNFGKGCLGLKNSRIGSRKTRISCPAVGITLEIWDVAAFGEGRGADLFLIQRFPGGKSLTLLFHGIPSPSSKFRPYPIENNQNPK